MEKIEESSMIPVHPSIVGVSCDSLSILVNDSDYVALKILTEVLVGSVVFKSNDSASTVIVGKSFCTVALAKDLVAVEVVTYRIAVERDQTVVGVILEAAVWRRGYVARRVISKRFLRENNVAYVFGRSLGYTVHTIISITHFGRICK